MTDDDIQLYQKAVSHLETLARSEAARMRGGESLHLNLKPALEEKGIVLHPDDPAWRQLELAFIKVQQSRPVRYHSEAEGRDSSHAGRDRNC